MSFKIQQRFHDPLTIEQSALRTLNTRAGILFTKGEIMNANASTKKFQHYWPWVGVLAVLALAALP
ncbi:MAG TPA: hypothetical protein VIW67_01465, partial [Terriglobales bacterium]